VPDAKIGAGPFLLNFFGPAKKWNMVLFSMAYKRKAEPGPRLEDGQGDEKERRWRGKDFEVMGEERLTVPSGALHPPIAYCRAFDGRCSSFRVPVYYPQTAT
jgi:hypothetical protein